MATVREIEELAARFSKQREALVGVMTSFREEANAIERKYFPRLRRLVVSVKEIEAELLGAIEQSPEHFDRPRSVIFHGIKLGYRKGAGKLEMADADRTVTLIRKHLPDQADVLIETKERPVKAALLQLDVAQLKRIGCTVEDTSDIAFAKPIDGDVEKALKALLKKVPDDVEEAA